MGCDDVMRKDLGRKKVRSFSLHALQLGTTGRVSLSCLLRARLRQSSCPLIAGQPLWTTAAHGSTTALDWPGMLQLEVHVLRGFSLGEWFFRVYRC